MKRKKSLTVSVSLKQIFLVIAVLFAIASIPVWSMNAIDIKEGIAGSVTASDSLFVFAFGKTSKTILGTVTVDPEPAILVAFILLAVAVLTSILALVLSLMKKKSNVFGFFALLTGFALIASSILVLCIIPICGLESNNLLSYSLGIGSILFGIFGLIGGFSSLIALLLALKK